jgi:DinB family protein
MGDGLPEDLAEIRHGLEASDQEARALLADLDDERFNWRPDERSWSVAQCLDHLNVANRVYLASMRPAVEDARRRGVSRRGSIHPPMLERWFVRTLEPPPKFRLPAPRKIVPALRKTRAEVSEEWERTQADLADLLREAAPLDLNAARFKNPFLPLVHFRVGTGFLVIETHERRHLLQAQKVRSHPGFPHPAA